MKTLTLVLFFLCTIFYGIAQPTLYRKIAERQDVYLSSAWKEVDSFRWSFNANASLTELIALKKDASSNWNGNYRYTFVLDANENVLTQLRENWTGSNWINNTLYSNVYDANNNLILSNYDTWNSGSWKQTGKIEYTGYNTMHNYTQELWYIMNAGSWDFLFKNNFQYYPNDYHKQFEDYFTWDSGTSTWKKFERFYNTFYQDSIGTKTRLVDFNGNWMNESKKIYTYSPTPILRTSYSTKKWDTTQTPHDWIDDRLTTYSYNSINKLDKTQEKKYDTTTSPAFWKDLLKSQFLYNADSNLIEYNDEVYSSSWVNNYKMTLSYTGKKVAEKTEFEGNGSNWDPTIKWSYLFNSMDSVSFMQKDTFNGAVFIPKSRAYYYYNVWPLSSNHVLKDVYDGVLYPNPASENLTLSLHASKTSNISLTIFDLLGKPRLVISQPMMLGENKIQVPIQLLPTGNYTLHVNEALENSTKVFKFSVRR